MVAERRKSKRNSVSATELSINSITSSKDDHVNNKNNEHGKINNNNDDLNDKLLISNKIEYRQEKEKYLNQLKKKLTHITTLDLLNLKAENWNYLNSEEFEFLNKSSNEMQEVKKLVKQLSIVDLIKKESKKSKLLKIEQENQLLEQIEAKKLLENKRKINSKKSNSKRRKLPQSSTTNIKSIRLKVSNNPKAIAPKPSNILNNEDDEEDEDHEEVELGVGKRKRKAAKNAQSKIEAAIHQTSKIHVKKPQPIEDKSKTLNVISTNKSDSKEAKAIKRQYDNVYFTIWKDLSRKDAPKLHRLIQQANSIKMTNLKKTAILCARESKKWQVKTNKTTKDLQAKARRGMREMFSFWKRNEKEERELRKKAEREALDQAKKDEEQRESRRQARKLNFLITQTELYSHFIGRKIKTDEIEGNDSDHNFNNGIKNNQHDNVEIPQTNVVKHDVNSLDFDSDNEEEIQKIAAVNAQSALLDAQARAKQFDRVDSKQGELKEINIDDDDLNFQNPTSLGDIAIEQPKLLSCTLKEYQVKGLNWLANLYDQGINGILADEMGLGKTVQSISVLAYLAETHNIWGPFLVVSPASTLHNWQQEITRFVPDFKVLPYWGNGKDRKILRKFWDRKQVTYTKDSPFHVLVTSYQLIVADIQYFQRVKWQYMILDEAQAIKSSQSSRWKSLLSLQCRNRLLLTGTPIQNSMQELWALLHFIMPTLFDSHDEFSEWFSKDIESHAQSNTQLNEQQLRRLHVILKPFMLRRIKKNVQSELGDKIEIDVYCNLTNRQQKLYRMLRSQISIIDLIEKATSGSDDSNQSLINLVMQFRKVCNHPDLFERADVKSPFSFGKFAETGSFFRETNQLEFNYATENLISYKLPTLIYKELLIPNENNNLGFQNKYLYNLLNIWNPEYIWQNSTNKNGFTWLNFINENANKISKIAKSNLIERTIDLKSYTDNNDYHNLFNDFNDYNDNDKKFLLIYNEKTNSSNCEFLTKIQDKVYSEMYLNVNDSTSPSRATAPPIELICNTRSFVNDKQNELFNGEISQALSPLSLDKQLKFIENHIPIESWPKAEMLPSPINSKTGYSSIKMPSMNRFITDSTKLAKLDQLLVELKKNDHRVLVYFQMTKMMDLMEEYLTYRQYKYIRLDGSSKLDDRRDLVHDWQTRPEIFIFLLSTRAGGLGINLTAADTVIFYDSDWNPTIDSQAMDRAHRLGQTRQVTVYRLLVRGTIEERMRDRAKQKEHVQQVVMEGKATAEQQEQAVGFQKPSREVAFWLLDDDQAAEAIKKKNTEDEIREQKKNQKKQKKIELKKKNVNLEDMYHEGEGNFDDGSQVPTRNLTPNPK
ncbi:hypothetical protein WICMUC_000787 [Wickerhamomyces mucosus]|uniref:Chromatin-remodeling ATPase INO80 n=1 Tax=Wickerhamomyces mucosus TaxID=1378264 RepID=A0A9P8PXX6_9ASCO|nr:hypothetical protein WICMUC_000787 [Wickerhamomyces mucosus]